MSLRTVRFRNAAALVLASATIPVSAGYFAESVFAATSEAPAPEPIAHPAASEAGALTISADQARAAILASAADPAAPALSVADTLLDAETECVAKVVHHEARNQPRDGKLAVAQLMLNRVQSGRFATTLCGVANQSGQFFNTASYSPRHDAQWDESVEIAREVRAGQAETVAPGALFFHAAYQAPSRFFRSRTRVMTLGDHVFYR